jgi:predicted GNAT family acetyltransferase
MKLEIKKGSQLSKEFIQEWNELIKKEFKGYGQLKKKEFYKDVFFILENKNKLLSIGRIKSLKINFIGKNYKILVITDVVSIIKKKGYGKRIIQAMKKYIKRKGNSEIGFCHPKNTRFYEKCGLIIVKDGVKRCYYRDKNGKIHKNHWDKNLLCLEGKDRLISKIISNPKEKIKLSTNFF